MENQTFWVVGIVVSLVLVAFIAMCFGYGFKATGAFEYKQPAVQIKSSASGSIELTPPAK
ncbi:MAG TPA: hypothetical protein VJ642_04250 [Chromobacteriaceae bacterium]|nr:hypothetical protein [Chromobacteriaceae bacterium]